jgi:hypothetical protein
MRRTFPSASRCSRRNTTAGATRWRDDIGQSMIAVFLVPSGGSSGLTPGRSRADGHQRSPTPGRDSASNGRGRPTPSPPTSRTGGRPDPSALCSTTEADQRRNLASEGRRHESAPDRGLPSVTSGCSHAALSARDANQRESRTDPENRSSGPCVRAASNVQQAHTTAAPHHA